MNGIVFILEGKMTMVGFEAHFCTLEATPCKKVFILEACAMADSMSNERERTHTLEITLSDMCRDRVRHKAPFSGV